MGSHIAAGGKQKLARLGHFFALEDLLSFEVYSSANLCIFWVGWKLEKKRYVIQCFKYKHSFGNDHTGCSTSISPISNPYNLKSIWPGTKIFIAIYCLWVYISFDISKNFWKLEVVIKNIQRWRHLSCDFIFSLTGKKFTVKVFRNELF